MGLAGGFRDEVIQIQARKGWCWWFVIFCLLGRMARKAPGSLLPPNGPNAKRQLVPHAPAGDASKSDQGRRHYRQA